MALGPAEAPKPRGGVPVILILITLTLLLHSLAAEVMKLDMAPNAVDDSYVNCSKQMMELVTKQDGILQMELKAREDFREMWNRDNGACEKRVPGGTSHHMKALQAYGNSKKSFRTTFNQMVQTKGANETVYVDQFPFKSLHFLLTDAMRQANDGSTCVTVYFGTSKKYKAQQNTIFRFGKFTSSSKEKSARVEDAILDGEGTLFSIYSCSAVNFDNLPCKSEEISFLIAPNEVFRVQSIKNIEDDDDNRYTEIKLVHDRFLSNHDCFLVSRSIAVVTPESPLSCSVLALMLSVLIRVSMTA